MTLTLRPNSPTAGDRPTVVVGAPARRGRLLRAVEAVHGSSDDILTRAVDGALIAGAGVWAGLSGAQAAALALVSTASMGCAGAHAPRNPLEVRGVAWYPGRIVTPLAAVAALPVSTGLAGGLVTAAALAAAGALLVGLRVLTWALLYLVRQTGRGLRPTLVVARPALASMISSKLEAYPEAGLRPVVTADPARALGAMSGVTLLEDALSRCEVEHVIVVPEGNDDPILRASLERFGGSEIDLSVLPPVLDLVLRPRTMTHLGGVPLLPVGRFSLSRGAWLVKRAFDLTLGLVLLAAALPVIAVAAAAVRVEDGGPAFYRQARVGKGGRTFSMLKVRSMVVAAEEAVLDLRDQNVTDGLLFKAREDPRVTRVGRVIRRLSIDELPQLWNVVRGEMSLVGPRPLAVDPGAFGPLENLRHNVLPGITGFWQVTGGNGLTYQEMVKLDLAYIQDWSLWLDVRLLAATLPALAHRRGPA